MMLTYKKQYYLLTLKKSINTKESYKSIRESLLHLQLNIVPDINYYSKINNSSNKAMFLAKEKSHLHQL